MSSLHITFNTEAEWHALESEGFLSRVGLQYHWMNRDYGTFEDFLGALKQSKRKSIRQVRPVRALFCQRDIVMHACKST